MMMKLIMWMLVCILLLSSAAAQEKATESNSRIVGGNPVFQDGTFPYFAHIRIQFPDTRGSLFCGGTVIAPKAILTAAHCVDSFDSIVTVYIGKVREGDSSIEEFGVESIAIHPFFYSFQFIHDIAVLRLSGRTSVVPALLPFGRRQLPQVGQLVTAMGFGLTSPSKPSERLQQILIPVQPSVDCDIFGWGVNATRQFCAGQFGKVPCSGDSGGPAMVGTAAGDMIAGLISYGGMDCFSFPAVFTRVSAYEEFITDEVCMGSDQPAWCAPNILVNCFSGSSAVEVERRGSVVMGDLQLGDMVHVGNGKYEPIYSFGHLAHESEGNFLQVSTEKTKLMITHDHMVFTQSRGAVPALLLREGDLLLLGESGLDRITAIQTVRGRGMYAPFTPSGKIVVNGILASSYVSLNQKEGLDVFGGLLTLRHQWLAHAMQFPHRLACYHFGSCPSERYSPEGISLWVYEPLKMSQWMVKSSGSLNFLLVSAVSLLAALFVVLELFVVYPLLLAVTIILAMMTARYSLKCKQL